MPPPADLPASWLTRAPIAHRGLHDLDAGAPENSLAAFERSCRLGFAAELDVRLTRDGEVVVFHDRALQRLTGAPGRVEDRRARAVTRLGLLGTGERVPLLRDVLGLVDGRVPLLIELKPCALGPALEQAVLYALRGYRGDVAIQSFKRRSVKRLGRADAPHAVGHLWRRLHLHGAQVRPAFYGCHVAVADRAAVRRRRQAGTVVLAWTVRSPEQARDALRFVDNYIFEGFLPDARVHPLNAPRTAGVAAR
jgi:glycerophosphoryl diester phosphodiesterase